MRAGTPNIHRDSNHVLGRKSRPFAISRLFEYVLFYFVFKLLPILVETFC